MRRPLDGAVDRRLNVSLRLDDGWSFGRVAAALDLDASPVIEHRRLSLDRGQAGVES